MGKIDKFVTSLAVEDEKIGKIVKESMIVKRKLRKIFKSGWRKSVITIYRL